MTNLTGTNLAAKIVPFTTEDTYATHESTYGKGGWHEVATLDERNAIPADRLSDGMAVYVLDMAKIYIYNQGEWIDYINQQITSFSVEVVEVLPEVGTNGVLYMVKKEDGELESDVYNEYVWVSATQSYELLGDTFVDLTGFYNKEDVDTLLVEKANLTDIPTKVSELKNDMYYLTEHQSLDNYYEKDEITDLLDDKQDLLTAGENVTISDGVISVADTVGSTITIKDWRV